MLPSFFSFDNDLSFSQLNILTTEYDEKDKTFIGMTWQNPSTAESKISEKPKYRESNTSLNMVMFGNVKLKLKVLSSQFYPAPLGSRLRAVFKALLQQSLHPPLFRTVFAEPWNVKRPFQGKKGFYELTSSRFNRRNVPRQAGPDLSWGPMAGRLFCCWCVGGVFWNLQLPFHH